MKVRNEILVRDLSWSRTVNGSPALGTGVVVALGLVPQLQQHPQSAGDVPSPHALPRDGEVLQLSCKMRVTSLVL